MDVAVSVLGSADTEVLSKSKEVAGGKFNVDSVKSVTRLVDESTVFHSVEQLGIKCV